MIVKCFAFVTRDPTKLIFGGVRFNGKEGRAGVHSSLKLPEFSSMTRSPSGCS